MIFLRYACLVCAAFCLPFGGLGIGVARGQDVGIVEQAESQMESGPRGGRWQQPLYREWKPDWLFDDPKVIQLCNAIAERDYEQIDRLVKIDGVNVNSRGYQDITPMLWGFALFWPESAQSVPDRGDTSSEEFNRRLIVAQQRILAEYSRLLEHLMKLGADPNAKLAKPPPRTRSSVWVNSPMAFEMREGLALTHVSTRHYLLARYSFFELVMANGGDPHLIYNCRGVTPIFLVCNNGRYLPNVVGIAPSEPKSLAILVDAEVDLEFRDPQGWSELPKGNTPILAAAEAGNFDLVYMLLHAGADFRVVNERNWGLARYSGDYLRTVEKLPHKKTRPGWQHKVDAYFLDVVRFLEDEGAMVKGTYPDFKSQIHQLVEESDKVEYGERDPFVDKWVAKRKKAQDAAADRETSPLGTPE